MLTRATFGIDQAPGLAALTQLSAELARNGVLGKLNVVRGTAMVLAFNARNSTKDVDAIFEPSSEVRAVAAVVADNLALPADWLNDPAKRFMSALGDFVPIASLDFPNLRVQAPTAEYMPAMKMLASRAGIGSERGDSQDDCLPDPAVMRVVSRYYDPSRILPRSTYLLDEILERINS